MATINLILNSSTSFFIDGNKHRCIVKFRFILSVETVKDKNQLKQTRTIFHLTVHHFDISNISTILTLVHSFCDDHSNRIHNRHKNTDTNTLTQFS